MNQSKAKVIIRKSTKMTCVRFSKVEYKKISTKAKKKNMSIPELLKLCYETVHGNPIELPQQELLELTSQLKRIGNNINTTLRKINSGEYHILKDIKTSLETSSTETGIIMRKIGKILK